MIPGIVTRFCSRQLLSVKNNVRHLSEAVREKNREQEKMLSWQIHAYGNLEELQLSQQTRIPYITNPDEVLIKVHASSVNPIDVEMISGFGSTALNLMRKMDNVEFPLTLGRDFSGTVVSKGLSGANEIPVGAAVWGVVPVHQQGCHAEYVIVDRRMISAKPKNLDTHEAASMLYAGLTAYSGLKWSANLNMENMSGLRALVLGASGGVGTSAVQLLRYGSAKVTATCASDAVPMVEGLGADLVLDYTDPDFERKLCDNGRYDLILDCAGLGTDCATKKPWEFRTYVTFTTPVLKNLDKLGLFRGVISSASDILCPNIDALKKGRAVKWAYFVPTAEGIDHIYNLVTAKKMRPIVQQIYKFNETPEAYKRLQKGHLRGKIVIDISG